MAKELSNFLGNGEGGYVNRLGMNWEEFSKFIDKADTDTAYEGWAARKDAQKITENPIESSRKRSFNGDGLEPPRKRVNSQDIPAPFAHSEDRLGSLSVGSSLASSWTPMAALDNGQGLQTLLGLRPSFLHPMVPGPSTFDAVSSISNHINPFSDTSTSPGHTQSSHARPSSPRSTETDAVNQISDMKIQEAIKLIR